MLKINHGHYNHVSCEESSLSETVKLSKRLSKKLSELGLCSRRQADEWILRGWVLVNGSVVQTLGARVTDLDLIELHPEACKAKHKFKTIILNKPVGFVSSQPEGNYPSAATLLTLDRYAGAKDKEPSEDPYQKGRPIDFQLTKWRVAGRLDIDSRGLLLLTQDPIVVSRIISPNSKFDKEYVVRMTGTPKQEKLRAFQEGRGQIEGQRLRPVDIFASSRPHFWHFCLREGKKRQIRKMAEEMGCKVEFLMRIRIGPIKLGSLPEGCWRFLDDAEVDQLISPGGPHRVEE
jgi:23S rRNA pseudouridine2604 synthase